MRGTMYTSTPEKILVSPQDHIFQESRLGRGRGDGIILSKESRPKPNILKRADVGFRGEMIISFGSFFSPSTQPTRYIEGDVDARHAVHLRRKKHRIFRMIAFSRKVGWVEGGASISFYRKHCARNPTSWRELLSRVENKLLNNVIPFCHSEALFFNAEESLPQANIRIK